MAGIKVISRGEEAKFRVEIKEWDMEAGVFWVELVHGYRRTRVKIEKGQMLQDDEYRWYFVFDTDEMAGRVVARCVWEVVDADASGGVREMVDEQVLCFVSTAARTEFACDSADQEGPVVYTWTGEADLGSDSRYVCDFYDHRLTTADGEEIKVLRG